MTNPIVFTDFHHASLLNSLILLFEKRLGGQVFRPIGRDWYDKGYWFVYDHPSTIEQYLGIGGATPDGTARLNEPYMKSHFQREGIYYCRDIDSGFYNKAITTDAFLSVPFDIVIASIPEHVEPYQRLCELHPNRPKLIYQIGNEWNIPNNAARNVMASANIIMPPIQVNFVGYHQEFDLDIFKFEPYNYDHEFNEINSFVNCFGVQDNFTDDWNTFLRVENEMPDYRFNSYGGQCRDGAAHGSRQLAEKMKQSMFIWHTKAGGDGYGHVLFNSAAMGRPLIVKKEYYAGKLGEKLLIDGVTCITIDGLSVEHIVEKIRFYSQEALHRAMVNNVYQNFKQNVDFNADAERIKIFLDNLK